jgi:hypothetical protein
MLDWIFDQDIHSAATDQAGRACDPTGLRGPGIVIGGVVHEPSDPTREPIVRRDRPWSRSAIESAPKQGRAYMPPISMPKTSKNVEICGDQRGTAMPAVTALIASAPESARIALHEAARELMVAIREAPMQAFSPPSR